MGEDGTLHFLQVGWDVSGPLMDKHLSYIKSYYYLTFLRKNSCLRLLLKIPFFKKSIWIPSTNLSLTIQVHRIKYCIKTHVVKLTFGASSRNENVSNNVSGLSWLKCQIFPPFLCVLFIICLVFQDQFGFIGTLHIFQGSTWGLHKILWELGASGWFGWNYLTSLVTLACKIKWDAEAKDNVNEKTSWLFHQQNRSTANFIPLKKS